MARLPVNDTISADASNELAEPLDWKLCRQLAADKNVIGIPASSFFTKGYEKKYGPLARFAFCKLDETLLEASMRLGGTGMQDACGTDEFFACAAQKYVESLGGKEERRITTSGGSKKFGLSSPLNRR